MLGALNSISLLPDGVILCGVRDAKGVSELLYVGLS